MKTSIFKASSGRKAMLALLLLVPASSIGVATELYIFPGSFGHLVSFVSRIWQLILPIVWFVRVDKGKLKFKYPKQRDLIPGVGLGLLMLGIILIVYWLLGPHWIDIASIRDRARDLKMGSPIIYLAGAVYWVFINSLMEEFVWRWFVYRKCEILVLPWKAVLLSALFFTLHHTVGLAAYFDWRVTALGSLAVFLAGAVWSWCYLTYRSIWPAYISHLFADIAISIIGWQLIFG